MNRAVVVVVALLTGCPVWIDGRFDDVDLQLGGTAVAVLDEHDVLERDGALIPVQRAPRDRRVHLWLSGATLPADVDWLHLDDARLLDIRQQLAANDLLVVRDLSFDDLSDGEELLAASGDDAAADDDTGPFTFSLSHRRLGRELTRAGLGGRISVEVEPTRVDEDVFEARLFVRRQRAVDQPIADVVTGEVIISVALTPAPERLAEANLGVTAPIAACGQARGPGSSLACADSEPDPRLRR